MQPWEETSQKPLSHTILLVATTQSNQVQTQAIVIRHNQRIFFQLSMEIGGGEKLNYQTLASFFPSSNTGHTLLTELSPRGQTKSLLHPVALCVFVFLLADTANRNAVTTVQLTWRRLPHTCANPPGQQRHHSERCVSPQP